MLHLQRVRRSADARHVAQAELMETKLLNQVMFHQIRWFQKRPERSLQSYWHGQHCLCLLLLGQSSHNFQEKAVHQASTQRVDLHLQADIVIERGDIFSIQKDALPS